MPDLLKQGLAWLSQQRTNHMTSEVSYQRAGQEPLPVPATFGKTEYDVADQTGASIRTQVTDFLMLAEDLGVLYPPQRGDILIADGTQYEVLDLLGDGFWRWSDPYHNTLRIHTKDIGPPESPLAPGNQP